MFFAQLFLILTFLSGRCSSAAPKIQLEIKDGAHTVNEGDNFNVLCHGNQPMEWRTPDRHSACYPATGVKEISQRLKILSGTRQNGAYHFSKLTLQNASYLDTGYVHCAYTASSEVADVDRVYLFVQSKKHTLMPCSRPESKFCKLPPSTSHSSALIHLKDYTEFVPCRPTSPDAKLQVYLDGTKENLTANWNYFRGFQLLEIDWYENYVSCSAENGETCDLHLEYKLNQHVCLLELKRTAPESIDVFVDSDVTLTCDATCQTRPDGPSMVIVQQGNPTTLPLAGPIKRIDDGSMYRLQSQIIIEKVAQLHDGVYTCFFSLNGYDLNTSIALSVRVPDKPSFVDPNATLEFLLFPADSSDSAVSNDSITLDCLALGTPSPSYHWLRGALGLREDDSQLEIDNNIDAIGDYSCFVNNTYGSITRDFAVRAYGNSSVIAHTANPHNLAGWVIGIVAAVVFGAVLTIVALTLFIYYRLRRNNRRVKLQAIWAQYFSPDGFMPLSPSEDKSICIEPPDALSKRAQSDRTVSTNETTVSDGDMWLSDRLDQIPYNNSVYEIDPTKLEFKEVLGRGAFGVVYKADMSFTVADTTVQTIPVAVKCIRDSFDVDQYRSLSSEIKLLATVGHHVNIVNLIGAVTKNLKDGILYMVLEYCSGGSLRQFLNKHRDRFFPTEDFDYFTMKNSRESGAEVSVDDDQYLIPSSRTFQTLSSTSSGFTPTSFNNKAYSARQTVEDGTPLLYVNSRGSQVGYVTSQSQPMFTEVYRERLSVRDLTIFAYQIANGMQFLHDKHCLHRDLAARNILVCSGNVLKISDFGLAKDVQNYAGEYTKKGEGKVPFKWLAPECINYKIYNKETDVWAFGVLMWEIFTLGKVPYPEITQFDENFVKFLENDLRLPQPEYADGNMYRLILSCWDSNSKTRPSFMVLKDKLRQNLPSSVVQYYETVESVPSSVDSRPVSTNLISQRASQLAKIPEEHTPVVPKLPKP